MFAALLWLGSLLGVRHAFEADHLATVGSLATGEARPLDVMRVAAAWGLGHAVVLLGAGASMVAVGATFSPPMSQLLEGAVGVVLVILGIDVLRRAREVHRHSPLTAIREPRPPLLRAFAIGALHGLEGSGAVVLIALPALRSTAHALAYLAVFGVGSILGMIACSVALTLPLGALRRVQGSAAALQLAIGLSTLLIGGSMAFSALRITAN